MFAGCELHCIAHLHIHIFRGWAIGYKCASSLSVWRVQSYKTQRSKGCIAFDLTLIMSRFWPSNPNIDKLLQGAFLCFPLIRFLWPGFCFGQDVMFSCILRITHHALVNCTLSVPQPDERATTASMPCSSVSRGGITLNLGQVYITSNLVHAALTTPQRPATDPNHNHDNMNPQSNPKRHAWYLVMAP